MAVAGSRIKQSIHSRAFMADLKNMRSISWRKKVPMMLKSRPISVWCWDFRTPLLTCRSWTGGFLGFRLGF
uniref:Uncharacterized protein n=1 Tax=Rhizophora mucronata TaxID=61149 RepID=A0A2P2PKC5_RHIMU